MAVSSEKQKGYEREDQQGNGNRVFKAITEESWSRRLGISKSYQFGGLDIRIRRERALLSILQYDSDILR